MLELCRHILYVGITSTGELELCWHIFEMLELRRQIKMAGIDNLQMVLNFFFVWDSMDYSDYIV